MEKGTYEAYQALKKAMDAQERFGVDTEYHGVDMDERIEIGKAIGEVLRPFYVRRLKKAMDAQERFNVITDYHGADMDERIEIGKAIDEVLRPFYVRRLGAVYKAAKAFVAAYEDAQNDKADTDTGLAHAVKAFMEGSKC